MKSLSRARISLIALATFLSGALFLWLDSLDIFADILTVSNVTINPDLDVSYFGSYAIEADITGTPNSVTVEVAGINQDGGEYWNYYVDGTAASDSIIKTMIDADTDGYWISESILPDNIYPEIFFAPSAITWNNTPSDIDLRRANYHVLHFENPFVMEADANFFIEFYAAPNSLANSADLEVYLVSKDRGSTFFESDWRNSSDVELVGTVNHDMPYNHTHVADKSSHFLVRLETNPDGTVGDKSLDISDDFWIILYSKSPNNDRGWSLKYHMSDICDNMDSWYIGNQAGWTVTAQSGCPDAHIHMVRRGTPSDGVSAVVTANYAASDPVVSFSEIYFEPLPNLAPNATIFTSPIAGSVYDENEIQITWDPASDPNGDNLTYTISYYDDTTETPIVSGTSSTSYAWDVSAIVDGSYGLKGEVCDDTATPLCTEFHLTADFVIDKTDSVYSLSGISISSDNDDPTLAKAGDTITLSFTASGDISSTLSVVFYSGGDSITEAISQSAVGNVWTVSYVVSSSDTDGTIDYVIIADNLDLEYSASAPLTVDVTDPDAVSASPVAGTYDSSQSVVLSSTPSDTIRYTSDGTDLTCSSGAIYSSALTISSPTTLKVIACDDAGNSTSVSTFAYSFTYSFVYSASMGGSLSGDTSQSVEYGADSTSITAVPAADYEFSTWSDGIISNPRTDMAASENINVNAIFAYAGGGAGIISPPGGIGTGIVDKTVHMNEASSIGAVGDGGINVLTYINSRAIFSAPQSSLDWQSGEYSFGVIDLDLLYFRITLLVGLDEIYMKKDESLDFDLDGDSINDVRFIFAGTYRNRAEITILSLKNDKPVEENQDASCEYSSGNFGSADYFSGQSTRFIFEKNLYYGLADSDVRELQKFLNGSGYTLTGSGYGSLGNETEFFGPLTRAAVINLQKAYDITPTIGYFGPITRGVVNGR